MSIKNGDLPAMPVKGNCVDASGAYCGTVVYSAGMTKREMFAMAMAQGLVSSGMDWTLYDHRDVSEQAVIMADALLAELERTK